MSNWDIGRSGSPQNEFSTATLTGHASANTKGSYSQLIASTAFRYDMIEIILYGIETAVYAVDLAIGASGSEQIIVPDLFVAGRDSFNRGGARILLPISIPSGSRIAARMQGDASAGWAGTAENISVGVNGIQGGWLHPGAQGTYCLAHNFDSATTTPTNAVTATGSYAQLVASLADPAIGMFLCYIPDSITGSYPINVFDEIWIATGAAASEVTIMEGIGLGGEDTGWRADSGYYPLDIAAGVRLSFQRGSELVATHSNSMGVILYTVH